MSLVKKSCTTPALGMLWSFICDVSRLIHSWWSVDRIRVSPTDGALLRLPVRTVLRIAGESWLVQSRWVCDGIAGPMVRYHCTNGLTTASLEVRPDQSYGQESVRWTSEMQSRGLHPSDIEVYESVA